MIDEIIKQIEKLRGKIKNKPYWGVNMGLSMDSKLKEYARTGVVHLNDGSILSDEGLENMKRTFWIMSPTKFAEIFPNEDVNKILEWAKEGVRMSEFYEKNPKYLSSDEGLENGVFDKLIKNTQEELDADKNLYYREKELKAKATELILNPNTKDRWFLIRETESQYPEIPSAFHLLKVKNGFSLVYVSVPKWYFGDDDFDNSKTDKELLVLQEIEVGLFTKDKSDYIYTKSGGWDLKHNELSLIKAELKRLKLIQLMNVI